MDNYIKKVREDLKNEQPINDEVLNNERIKSFEIEIRMHQYLNQLNLR